MMKTIVCPKCKADTISFKYCPSNIDQSYNSLIFKCDHCQQEKVHEWGDGKEKSSLVERLEIEWDNFADVKYNEWLVLKSKLDSERDKYELAMKKKAEAEGYMKTNTIHDDGTLTSESWDIFIKEYKNLINLDSQKKKN